MWILFHFIFLYFCQPSALMHLVAAVAFYLLTHINTKKLGLKDVVPSLSLTGMYIGFYLTQELYHWGYLPWWVVTICGFRKQKGYIWFGGIVLGCMFHFMDWRQRIGHCMMNIARMLKITQQSMASLVIVHAFLGILFGSIDTEVKNIYVDVLAGLSAVVCACIPDNMSWFSIGMLFTHPFSGALCIIHAASPYWYNYYKNNHYRKVKYSVYYAYPILILVGLLFREEIQNVRETYNV